MILYYMNGCPHCATNQSAWDQAKDEMKEKAEIKEIESANAPTIKSFPTMVFIAANGKEKRITGARKTGEEILEELKIRNEGGSRVRRRNTRGRATRGRNRKIRHRTLRNHIAFV